MPKKLSKEEFQIKKQELILEKQKQNKIKRQLKDIVKTQVYLKIIAKNKSIIYLNLNKFNPGVALDLWTRLSYLPEDVHESRNPELIVSVEDYNGYIDFFKRHDILLGIFKTSLITKEVDFIKFPYFTIKIYNTSYKIKEIENTQTLSEKLNNTNNEYTNRRITKEERIEDELEERGNTSSENGI